MDLPPQIDQVLDHQFFRATGLVMIAGTLLAGVITLSIAANMVETETTEFVVSNVDAEPAEPIENVALK